MHISKIIVKLCLYLILIPPFLGSIIGQCTENGVSTSEILFGQTAAFEGAAGKLGQDTRTGLLAYFKKVNDAGGINGRMLVIKHKDDDYEPEEAIRNTKTLINDDKVFALIGTVGTPTAKAILPIVFRNKIPLIGPMTGANFLRTPYNRYIVNLRASYEQETEIWIERLIKDLKAKRIAAFYQDDSFGTAAFEGVKKAMQEHDLSIVAEGKYMRNTTAVKTAVLQIKKANPDAIVTIGTYKPIAEFIRLAQQIGLNAPIINLSFTGSKALVEELGEQSEGIVISQAVPFPFDTSVPLVAEYQKAIKAYDPAIPLGFVSLEGYIIGKLTAQILSQVENPLTREKFLDVIEKQKTFDLGGVVLEYGDQDNQGLDLVYLTKVNAEGEFEIIDNLK